ncbi:hypothetical protein H072_9631 [Dactylellina haptotyla CBS 200.50]|uniref:SET domain-containing protein n=1 Tax=Dactylellina haptotyla (strain CBS 200.50) TaxID=1284197 RepID=S8A2C9_DACHA|nr:hypothetical protein H072_9631 [Dactylellina haptotyla CBS 200.50]
MPKRRRPPLSRDFLADDVPQVHRTLLEHVLANNAKLSKVKIAKLPHGIGIVASENIGKNEDITFIPKSLLVNLHDIPIPNSSPIDYPTRVHSSLAAYIASKRHNGENDPFISILPSPESFKTSMPMSWSDEVLSHCSPWVRSFALKQKEKLQDDYDHAVKVHTPKNLNFTQEEYDWAWAVVNTRTIYYRPKKWYKIPAEDCMTMCPFIDYYNHDWRSDDTCIVSFSTDGLTVTTQKAYVPGEEIFVTYGEYNNDHLLVEYGFTLPNNGSDNIKLDFWVLGKLSGRHQEILKEKSFHGYALTFKSDKVYSGSDLMVSVDGDGNSEYVLDAEDACYRTMMALRLAVIPSAQLPRGNGKGGKRYLDFVKLVEGEMEEDDYGEKYSDDEGAVRGLLGDIVNEAEELGRDSMENLRGMLDGPNDEENEGSISSAIERWTQMLDVINKYKQKTIET